MTSNGEKLKDIIVKLAQKKKIALPEYIKNGVLSIEELFNSLYDLEIITKEQLLEVKDAIK